MSVVVTYRGPTAAEATGRYYADALPRARAGWVPLAVERHSDGWGCGAGGHVPARPTRPALRHRSPGLGRPGRLRRSDRPEGRLMMELVDFYRILQVDPRAEPEVVRAAYRSLARKYHPDVVGGSAERMVAINQAWDVLGDQRSRKAYDKGRSVLPTRGPPTGRPTCGAGLGGGRPPAARAGLGHGPRLRPLCRLVVRPAHQP